MIGCGKMIRIGFVRHGVTDWNRERRAQGHSDVPLNDEGRLEAAELAERLQQETWDVIYVSDLERAKETAETIRNKMKNVPIYFDSRLREVSRGLMEGTTEAERTAKWGPNWRELDLATEDMGCVLARARSVMDRIISEQNGKNVLIVSHGTFIRNLLQELLPNDDVDISLGNCSLTVVEKKEEVWELLLHNCTRHITMSL